MNNKEGKIGSILMIVMVLLIILGLSFVIFTVANTDIDDDTDKRTILEMNKKKKKEEEEVKKKESKDNFLNVIGSLEYISDKRYIDYHPIMVDTGSKKMLYNPEDKNLVVDDVESYEWYGSFGIVYGDVNKIYNNKGEVLFSSKDSFSFYSNSGTWIYRNTLYSKSGEIKTFDKLIDLNKDGKYYLGLSNSKLQVLDKNGKITYEKEIKDKITIISGEMDSIYSVAYALISYNKSYAVINPENGKVIIDFISDEIEKKDNVFYTDDKTYFIKDDKIAIELNKKVKNIEVSSKYLALDNNVYNISNMSLVDSNMYINEDAYIEKITKLEKTSCRLGYGLKYNNNEILDCNYEDIYYFDERISEALLNANKLYVILKLDDKYELYDVKNKKVIIEGVLNFEKDSQFMEVSNGIDTYVYNIITSKESFNVNSEELEFGYNYYALLSNGSITYYNKDDEVIYEGKI